MSKELALTATRRQLQKRSICQRLCRCRGEGG